MAAAQGQRFEIPSLDEDREWAASIIPTRAPRLFISRADLIPQNDYDGLLLKSGSIERLSLAAGSVLIHPMKPSQRCNASTAF